jgi:thiamine biosynthesis lipoprotein
VKAPKSHVNRRDLFRGGRLRSRPETAPVPRFTIMNARRAAMGSFFEVRLSAQTPAAADLATRALDVVEDLEGRLTVYRDDSEISRLNAAASDASVTVQRDVFDLLARAVAIGRETGGAYDVTSGALSVAWGFLRGPRRVPDAETLADARSRTGAEFLRLDESTQSVRFDRPGLMINLGSIGKGYAIDRAADVIRNHWWPTSAVIHGGGSSLFAIGSPPDEFGGRWEISIRNPLDPETPIGRFRLRNRGLGTSGAAFQQFEEGGRIYGHILDPRTGEPCANGPLSVSVIAPTAADADALSTAFYLLGPHGAADYVRRHPEVGALFVLAPTEAAPMQVLTLGLTAADVVIDSRFPHVRHASASSISPLRAGRQGSAGTH